MATHKSPKAIESIDLQGHMPAPLKVSIVDPPVAALLVIQGARSKFHAVESGSSRSSL